MYPILSKAKAIAALVGAVVTAVLGVVPSEEYRWLVIVGVVATAIATYQIPNVDDFADDNIDPAEEGDVEDDDEDDPELDEVHDPATVDPERDLS